MSKARKASAIVLLTINLALLIFLTWHQITVAAEGRNYGLDEHPPFIFLLVIASLVAAAGVAVFTGRYGLAIVGGAPIALFLGALCLVLLAGVGM